LGKLVELGRSEWLDRLAELGRSELLGKFGWLDKPVELDMFVE